MKTILIILVVLLIFIPYSPDKCFGDTYDMDGNTVIYEIPCDMKAPIAYPIFRFEKFWRVCNGINDCYFGVKAKG